MLLILLMSAALVLTTLLVWWGGPVVSWGLVLAILFAVYTLCDPMPALGVATVVGTNVFQVVSLENLPYIQIAAVLRQSVADAFTLLFLAVVAHDRATVR